FWADLGAFSVQMKGWLERSRPDTVSMTSPSGGLPYLGSNTPYYRLHRIGRIRGWMTESSLYPCLRRDACTQLMSPRERFAGTVSCPISPVPPSSLQGVCS